MPGYVPIGIRSNHIDMTKFEKVDEPGFVAVAGELGRWCRELSLSSTSRGPGDQPARAASPPRGSTVYVVKLRSSKLL